MREFDSEVFKSAVDFSKNIRRLVRSMHNTVQFTIGQQLLRSAISIPSNIAEGFGRNSDAQILNFLNIANGSCCEAVSQLMVLDGEELDNSTFVATELITQAQYIKNQLRKLIYHFNTKR